MIYLYAYGAGIAIGLGILAYVELRLRRQARKDREFFDRVLGRLPFDDKEGNA